MYKRNTNEVCLLIGVYVDDLIITGSSNAEIGRFKEQMMQKFSMSDLGLLSYYLGIEVKQTDQGISLCQTGYAAKIIEQSGMKGCNPCVTPMENRLKLSKKSEDPAVDTTMYRSIVGSLRYLVNTRPDIAYAVGIVSGFMESPTIQHFADVKHILRYVNGTLNFGCNYERIYRTKDNWV